MSPAGSKDKSPREIAQIAASTVSSLGIDPEKVLAVGHSMGSMIVCELALEVPLRGLVLIGPVHPTAALGDIFSQRIQKVEQSKTQDYRQPCQVTTRVLTEFQWQAG